MNTACSVGRPELPAALVSYHACKRMHARNLRGAGIEAALRYGREVHTRGARIYAIGRREVVHFARHDVDLSAFAGVQVVCSFDGQVVTVYRNHDFRGLRSQRRRR